MTAVEPTATTAEPAGASRRDLAVALALTVLGSALALLSVGRTWAAVVVREAPLPATHVHLSGRAVAPVVGALGIAGLAAAVALLATRGRARIAVGAVVALIGAGLIGSAASVSTGDVRHGSALRERVPAAAHRDADAVVTLEAWRHVAAAGGLAVVAAGLLTVARGRTWSAMGRRYDAPTARSSPTKSTTDTAAAKDAQPESTSRLEDSDLWERIERGDDPTA